jgi:4-hydroxybenzoate polyprenyltransferase
LGFAKAAHAVMILFLLVLIVSPLLGGLYLMAVAMVAGLLWYEHSLVSGRDLSKVNVAFFNVNGWISLSLMALVIADCVWV